MHLALDELEKFIHASESIPALARLGMIHCQFEAIHPFLDGNGRVGRLLAVLLLCEWGLLPQPLLNIIAYIERFRQEYYDHLQAVSRQGDWEVWLRFFFRGVSEQACADANRIERLKDIRIGCQTMIAADRNPQRMAAVVDFIFSRPILSISQLAKSLSITFNTARNYLAKLERVGLVRDTTGYAHKRIFRSDEILNVIQTVSS